jgi:hypothetical protein
VTINFNQEKTLEIVSDYYKAKDGSLQDKEAKFQIMYIANN